MLNRITRIWPGGEHVFALNIGELRALQQACDAGPEQLFRRFYGGEWRVDDVKETIRLGLVGGGLGEIESRRLVDQVIGDALPFELKLKVLAAEILAVALNGVEDDPVGEQVVEGPKAPKTDAGVSPDSTATAP
jgi:hypothetical protein